MHGMVYHNIEWSTDPQLRLHLSDFLVRGFVKCIILSPDAHQRPNADGFLPVSSVNSKKRSRCFAVLSTS